MVVFHGQSVTGSNVQSYKSKFRHLFRVLNRPNKLGALKPSMKGDKKKGTYEVSAPTDLL